MDLSVPVFCMELEDWKAKNSRNILTFPVNSKEKVEEYEIASNTNHSLRTQNNPHESRKENERIKNPKKNLLSWVQHGRDQQEYLVKSWRADKTCCHSDFSENLKLLRMQNNNNLTG